MYSIEDVQKIVTSVIKISSDSEADRVRELMGRVFRKKKEEAKRPEYYSIYRSVCEMRDRIRVHSEECEFPEMLFRSRAPRMTDDEYNYIKGNFKQTTLPVYLDFLSTLNRVFDDNSWSVKFKEEDAEFQKYVEEEVPEYGSLENFWRYYVPHIKLTDAFGSIVVRPKEFKTLLVDEQNNVIDRSDPAASAGAREILDDAQDLEPYPIYFRCDQLVAFRSQEYYLYESDEKSIVDYGGGKQQIGRCFEFYDEDQIFLIRQVGKYQDKTFEVRMVLNHGWGEIPVHFLQGVPRITKEGTMWISPFFYAVDTLDLALLNEMYLQISINNCVYPYRILEGPECDFEHTNRAGDKIRCNDGVIDDIAEDSRFTCPACNGFGVKNNLGPQGVMLIKRLAGLDKDLQGSSQLRDPMMFVEPGTNALEFLLKKIDRDTSKAKRILHLGTSKSEVQSNGGAGGGAPDLATGMVLDDRALKAFIKPTADQIFDLLRFMYRASAMYIFTAKEYEKHLPVVSSPVDYDLKTEADYVREISEAVAGNFPPFVIKSILERYVKARYYNETQTAQIFTLIIAADRLLMAPIADLELKEAQGLIEKWEIILHDSALTFVDELIRADKAFFTKKIDAQILALQEKAQQKVASIQAAKQAADALSALNQVDSVMAGTQGGLMQQLRQLQGAQQAAKASGDAETAKALTDSIRVLNERIKTEAAGAAPVL